MDLIGIQLAIAGPVVKDAGNKDGEGLIGLLADAQFVAVGTGKLDRLKCEDQLTGPKDPVAAPEWGTNDDPVEAPDVDDLTDKAKRLADSAHPLPVPIEGKLGEEA